jgi:hypothetical protein
MSLFKVLEKAAASGWRDAVWLERDPERSCLFGDPQLLDLSRRIGQCPAIDFDIANL